jgi:hypothetical protein
MPVNIEPWTDARAKEGGGWSAWRILSGSNCKNTLFGPAVRDFVDAPERRPAQFKAPGPKPDFRWEDILGLLSTQYFHPNWLSVIIDGAKTRPALSSATTGRLSIDQGLVKTAINSRGVLALNYLDEFVPNIRAWAEELEWQTCRFVNVNAYAGLEGSAGLSTHWDDHDVIAVTSEGAKSWRVFEPETESPLCSETHPMPTGRTHLSFTASTGDLLFVPRGFPHDVRTPREPSVHLTFAMYPVTGLDVARYLLKAGEGIEDARREISPWRIQGTSGGATDFLPSLAAMFHEGGLRVSILQHVACAVPRRMFGIGGLTNGEPNGDDLIKLAARFPPLVRTDSRAGQVQFGFCARLLRLPTDDAEDLMSLLQDGSASVTELVERTSNSKRDHLLTLLRELLESGLCVRAKGTGNHSTLQ